MTLQYEKENEFLFIWKIKNYSLCYIKEGEYLESPVVTANSLCESKWKLQLYPRGTKNFPNFIFCYLCSYSIDENEKIFIDLKFEMINPHGNVVYNINKSHEFKNNDNIEAFGLDIIMFNKLLESYLDDTLTIQCLLKMKPKPKALNKYEVHTNFKSVQSRHKWFVKKSDLPNWVDSINFKLPESIHLEIKISSPANDFVIKIKKNSISCLLVSCTISLLDVNGHIKFSRTERHFYEDSHTWEFPSFINKKLLETERVTVLKDEIFTLMFEFLTSNQIETVIFEENSYICSADNYNCFDAISGLQNDLYNLLRNQKHCDVNLQIDNSTFPVHKAVLVARSPVFAAMFEQEMLEKQTGTVKLTDIEEVTLKLFLNFLYTGKITIFDYKTAIKVLEASEKYQVPTLKEACSSLLMRLMLDCNVCEILTIASMMCIQPLKEYAVNYIVSNASNILSSSEWSEWVEDNIKLATEIFSTMAVSFGVVPSKTFSSAFSSNISPERKNILRNPISVSSKDNSSSRSIRVCY